MRLSPRNITVIQYGGLAAVTLAVLLGVQLNYGKC